MINVNGEGEKEKVPRGEEDQNMLLVSVQKQNNELHQKHFLKNMGRGREA
jgi:hypothetical protein